MKRLLVSLLFVACMHSAAKPACPILPSGIVPTDPIDLQNVVIGVKLRERERQLPGCRPEEICVASCEEGTVCAACDRVMAEALHQLAATETDEAARVAAALVLDHRLAWDGGHALTVTYAVARMKSRVLPYLEPHVSKSSLAKTIVDCIRRGHPCH